MIFFKLKIKFTSEEVNNLRKEGKTIIISNNKIYDLTNYINSHPGGKVSILNNQLNDCTQSFKFHSENAKKKWKKYKIGYLKKI